MNADPSPTRFRAVPDNATSVRYSDPATAALHPLTIDSAIDWVQGDALHASRHASRPGSRHASSFRTRWHLPTLPAGWIIVPSFTCLNAAYRFQFTLTSSAGAWSLMSIPAGGPPPEATGSDVSTHIDCFHTHAELAGAELELEVWTKEAPERYLATFSARPLTLDTAIQPSPRDIRPTGIPYPLSQRLGDASVAAGGCSPTAIAMILRGRRRLSDWRAFVRACRDPVTRAYGVWPLGLFTASRCGVLGSVEVFPDWQIPAAALAAGFPVVASVRFPTGGLTGAPLEQTGGHLLVVDGVDDGRVHVLDPAAPERATVQRHYDAGQFARAWFHWRGAGYILLK